MKFILHINDKEVGRFDNREAARQRAAQDPKAKAAMLGPSDGEWDGKGSRPRIYEYREARTESWTVLVP